MGTSDEAFCLKWNDFQMSIATSFSGIRSDCDLLDVTVQCGSTPLQAHRLILSACSSWFRDVFRALPSSLQNPVIVLWEASATDMRLLFDFMYNGEVNVKQENLNTFLALAERLQVRGLTQNETNASGGGGKSGQSAARSVASAPSDTKAQEPSYAKQTFSKRGDKVPSSPHTPHSTPPAKKARPQEDNDIEEVAGYQEGNDHSGQGGEMVSYDQDEMYDSYYEGDDGSGTPTQGSQDYPMAAGGMAGLESAKASFRATSEIASSPAAAAPFFVNKTPSSPYFVSPEKTSPHDGYSSPGALSHPHNYTSPGPLSMAPRHHMTFCTPCGRDYVNLRQHEEDCHGPNQQIPCTHCSKKFKSKNSMRVHKSMTHREIPSNMGGWRHEGEGSSNAD